MDRFAPVCLYSLLHLLFGVCCGIIVIIIVFFASLTQLIIAYFTHLQCIIIVIRIFVVLPLHH